MESTIKKPNNTAIINNINIPGTLNGNSTNAQLHEIIFRYFKMIILIEPTRKNKKPIKLIRNSFFI